MGNQLPGGPGGGRGAGRGMPGGPKPPPKRRKPDPNARKLGRKKVKKGGENRDRLPTVTPVTKCRLRTLKLDRIKDYLLMEQEFIETQEEFKRKKNENEYESGKNEEENQEKTMIDEIRAPPLSLGNLEEFIDEDHCIISQSIGPEYYVPIMSFVDRSQLESGSTVLCHAKSMAVVGIMNDDTDPLLNVMKVEKAPKETYGDVGGLENQIQELKEAVELPLSHPEIYEDIGIKPPKGVILYGEPGTGKTLLVKAVAHETSATFLRLVGSELIQKYLGDGPKLVRELFKTAEENSPSIVFIDEIDAVGTKRYDSTSGGEKEIQRTMLELLNQLDGFDSHSNVKVIMATNRIETLDPALIRPGRIDRKIFFPLPDAKTLKKIMGIHTLKMNLDGEVDLDEICGGKDDLTGADTKAICTEAGLLALRERRMKVTMEDFRKAKEKTLHLKRGNIPEGLYI